MGPFFKKMVEFQKNEKHPIIILKDVSFLHMSAILEFMYNGEVSVTQEELPAFLKTAEKLEIKGLAEDDKEGGEMSEVLDVGHACQSWLDFKLLCTEFYKTLTLTLNKL